MISTCNKNKDIDKNYTFFMLSSKFGVYLTFDLDLNRPGHRYVLNSHMWGLAADKGSEGLPAMIPEFLSHVDFLHFTFENKFKFSFSPRTENHIVILRFNNSMC